MVSETTQVTVSGSRRAVGRGVAAALAATLLLMTVVACKPPEQRGAATGASTSGGARLEMRVVGAVSTTGFALEVVATQDGSPLQGAEATVAAEMSHPGMPRLTWPAPEAEPGLYRVDDLKPDMVGDWILTAELVPPAGGKLTAELFLSVPR